MEMDLGAYFVFTLDIWVLDFGFELESITNFLFFFGISFDPLFSPEMGILVYFVYCDLRPVLWLLDVSANALVFSEYTVLYYKVLLIVTEAWIRICFVEGVWDLWLQSFG